MPSVRKNFLYNSAYQMLLVVAPIITTPYLARTIGADGNGLYSYSQAITNYFVLFAVLGMSNYGVRLIAEAGDNRRRRSEAFWNAFLMNLLFGLIAVSAFSIFALTVGKEHWQLWLCWSLWIIGATLDISWLFFGVQQFRIPTIRNFLTKLASIAVILLFVRSADDVWIYVTATSGAILMNSLLLWPFIGQYVEWRRPTWRSMTVHIRPNIALFIPVAAVSLYTVLDKILLSNLADLTQTGLYDYSEKIIKIPLSVVGAMGIVMLPRMSKLLSSGRTKEGQRLIGMSLWAMTGTAVAMMFGIISIIPEFVPVFLGQGYEATKTIILVLAPIILFMPVTNVLGIQYLLPRHRDRAFTATLLVGAVVNIGVTLLLVPHIGAVGTAVATLLTEFTVLVAQGLVVRGELPLRQYSASVIPFLSIGTIMAFLVRGIAYLLTATNLATSIVLLIEILVGGAFFLLAAIAWFIHTDNQYFNSVFPQIARWLRKSK